MGENLIDKINRTREITDNEIQELIDEAYENSLKYEPCDKCGFRARKKETGICSNCGGD